MFSHPLLITLYRTPMVKAMSRPRAYISQLILVAGLLTMESPDGQHLNQEIVISVSNAETNLPSHVMQQEVSA